MKRILLILIVISISIPFVTGWIKMDQEPSIFGDRMTMGQTIHKFSFHSWMNDIIQKKVEEAAVFNTGYHNSLIKFANELNYRILIHPKVYSIVSGKNGYLFDNNYLDEYTGKNYTGEPFLREKIKTIKIVQEYLLKEKKIYLIPVIEPGIVSFNREHIPMSAVCRKDGKTNYQTIKEVIKQEHLTCLDLEAYFYNTVRKSKFTIFPPKSLHWSEYGCYLAADTLFKFTSNLTNLMLPNIILDSIIKTDIPASSENEIEKTMNLLTKLKQKEYTHVIIHFDSLGKTKPNVLFVSDSYFLMFDELKVPSNLFSNYTLWYYNTTVHPFNEGPDAKYINKLNIKEELEKYKIIFLMANELNYYRMYWNFAEKVMEIYDLDEQLSEKYKAKNFIVWHKVLYPKLLKFANRYNIPFETALDQMAEMVIRAKHTPNDIMTKYFWSMFFTNGILKDDGYIDQLKNCAKNNNTTLDEEIYKASIFSYETDIIKVPYY